MAISAIAAAGAVTAGVAVKGNIDARKDRKKAEQQAAIEREQLAALQAEAESPMPIPDDEAARRARRRSIVAQRARRGRQSTILTDTSSDALGA